MIGSIHHVQTAFGLQSNLAYCQYWRDSRDRITAWQRGTDNSINGKEVGNGNKFQYDAEGQLTDAWYLAQDPGGNMHSPYVEEHFQYDQLGNRFGANQTVSYGVIDFLRRDNGLNQYASWTPSVIYHDDNYPGWTPGGNGALMADGYITASYNALNQPRAIWSPAYAGTPNYTWFGFDPLGRCVKRWVGATGDPNTNPALYMYYDGWNLIQEKVAERSTTRVYAHGARVDEVVASSNEGGAVYFHHYDALGNAILVSDGAGYLKEQYDYEAFGKPYFYDPAGYRIPASPWNNRFLFKGREWLSDLKLYDHRHRLYQPELGRFLQPDPKHFASGDYNLYRYCHNDPINRSDPLGLWSPAAHDYLFDYAFDGMLSATDIGSLKEASRALDRATIFDKNALHQHSQRQKGESVARAIQKREAFIKTRLSEARAAHKAGDRDRALKKFGEAAHTVQDKLSPAHRDKNGNPREYDFKQGLRDHSPSELSGKETRKDITDDIAESQKNTLREMWRKTFGR